MRMIIKQKCSPEAVLVLAKGVKGGVWRIKSSYPSPLRGAPLPQGSSTVRIARRLRETELVCRLRNAACELTGRGFKLANAASEQAGWSCPPKVGGRAKRRGYETKAKQHVKLQKFIPLTATRSSPASGEQRRPDGPWAEGDGINLLTTKHSVRTDRRYI